MALSLFILAQVLYVSVCNSTFILPAMKSTGIKIPVQSAQNAWIKYTHCHLVPFSNKICNYWNLSYHLFCHGGLSFLNTNSIWFTRLNNTTNVYNCKWPRKYYNDNQYSIVMITSYYVKYQYSTRLRLQ